jgi:hypothetical protein
MRRTDSQHHTVGTWGLAVLVGLTCVGLSTVVAAKSPVSDRADDDAHVAQMDAAVIDWWQPTGQTGDTCRTEFGMSTMDAMIDSTMRMRGALAAGSENDQRAQTPCSKTRSTGERASNNVCFEATGAPATIRPALIAKYRTAQQSRRIAGIARTLGPRDITSSDSTVADEGLLVLSDGGVSSAGMPGPAESELLNQWTSTATDVPVERDRRRAPASCSVSPVQCESVPPGPPGINGEHTASVHLTKHLFTSNEGARASGSRLPDYRRLGPADGFGSPPDPPPRRG